MFPPRSKHNSHLAVSLLCITYIQKYLYTNLGIIFLEHRVGNAANLGIKFLEHRVGHAANLGIIFLEHRVGNAANLGIIF